MNAWPPARYSAPLSPDFPSHADWLIPLVEAAWHNPDGSLIRLDAWQKSLLRAMLEVYPDGHPRAGQLRYRQYFVSVGRQNGKSILGAIMGLYGLLRQRGELVIGLASSADQARILFDRTLAVLRAHPSLQKRFKRLAETRGIESNDGSRYLIKPAKSSAVQGLDVSVGLFDELHISPPQLWSDLVSGTAARFNGIVTGFTTAGDEDSVLLLSLYELAEKPGERFGFAIWEAPEAVLPEDDETLGQYLMAANPSLAEGRLDLETAISDVRTLPPSDAIRYRLNRFVAAKAQFISPALWQSSSASDIPAMDRPVFAFTASKARDRYTVVAAQVIDGVTYAETVCTWPVSDLGRQVQHAEALYTYDPVRYVVHRWSLGGLAAALGARRYPLAVASNGDELQAAGHLYGLIANGRLRHDGNPLITQQVVRAQRKNSGEHFKIVPPEDGEIDVLNALAFACLYAHIESVNDGELVLSV